MTHDDQALGLRTKPPLSTLTNGLTRLLLVNFFLPIDLVTFLNYKTQNLGHVMVYIGSRDGSYVGYVLV